MTPILTKNFDAAATIAARRIVKITAPSTVAQAAAAADALIGVADELGSNSAGRVDVHLAGIVEVEAGAAIAIGALVTSDAQGRAVAAAADNRAVGVALVAAASAGEIISVLLGPSIV